jgi:hypothetical protein
MQYHRREGNLLDLDAHSSGSAAKETLNPSFTVFMPVVAVESFHYRISIMVSARGIALRFFLGYISIHRILWWVDIRQVDGL